MDKIHPSKSIIVMMIAKVRAWVLKGTTPKDIWGVRLNDHNNIFTVDSNGNRKATFLREHNGFYEFRVPVFFKPNLDSSLSIAQQAAAFILDKSPTYQEKLLDRTFKTMSKDNLKFVFGTPRKMIVSSYLDLDEMASSQLVKTPTVKLSRTQVVEVVEQPGDDKLEAYKAFGFVDILPPVVTRTTWDLPFVVKRPEGYVNPLVEETLKADALNGKERLLKMYQSGRLEWEDVSSYLPSSFKVEAYDFDEQEVEALVERFVKKESSKRYVKFAESK